MSWKKPKKSSIQNIAFILFIALLLFTPLGTLLGTIKPTAGLFAKDITASEQNKFQATNGN
jgi:hypothetical protein